MPTTASGFRFLSPLAALMALMSAGAQAQTAEANTQYRCEAIPSASYAISVYDINRHGKVVGLDLEAPPGAYAYTKLWRADGHEVLIAEGKVLPNAINDHTQIAGTIVDRDGSSQAFVWQDKHIQLLPSAGTLGSGTGAHGINAAGDIVGKSALDSSGSLVQATLWKKGVAINLGSLAINLNSYALGINDSGKVVGRAGEAADGVPVIWRQRIISRLALPTVFSAGQATDINNSGIVIGFIFTPGVTAETPVAWKDGKPHTLAMRPGDQWGEPTGINAKGRIVGTLYAGAGQEQPTIWYSYEGRPIDLNSRVPGGCLDQGGAAVHLRYAHGINDRGVIIASSDGESGGPAFRLIPIRD